MELLAVLTENYTIGKIDCIEPTEYGSGNSFFVFTAGPKYVAKLNERPDFISIYDKVQHRLNPIGLRQSRIIRTKDDQISTSDGVVLYEFINGSSHKNLTETQVRNALKYLRQYNLQLENVPFNPGELLRLNHWDKARSLDFLTGELPAIIKSASIEADAKSTMLNASRLLAGNKELLLVNRQLVHADLGPDNFLFAEDEVSAIIDFTPDYQHELYSLAQFIYWNCLWPGKGLDNQEILDIYFDGNVDELNKSILNLTLVQASLFRVIGPLLDQSDRQIEKRLLILKTVLG